MYFLKSLYMINKKNKYNKGFKIATKNKRLILLWTCSWVPNVTSFYSGYINLAFVKERSESWRKKDNGPASNPWRTHNQLPLDRANGDLRITTL